jgi:predicted outer membrane repeat protein
MTSPDSVEEVTKRHGVLRRSGGVGGSALLAGGAVGSAVLLSLFAAPAGAVTTFTVDTNADGVANASDCTTPVANSCSLRDALDAATTDGDIIVFDAALSGQTISLSEGQLEITAGITITGLGSANLTVDAGGTSRVFYIYTATTGVEVAISGLSIIDGDAQGVFGGGIYDVHDGDLTLDDVSITGCDADHGGGIYKDGDGTIEIVDSTISDNYARLSAGALYNNGEGDLIITNSTFDGNSADGDGGVGELGNTGNVNITDSTFSNNTANGAGGAIYFDSGVNDVSISGSTFSDNEANSSGGGGAIYAVNGGSFTISSSTFSGNYSDSWGGALYMGTTGQVITITDSLFVDNTSADEGGAIDFDADDQVVTINNSTFVDNTSADEGGAIWKEEGGSLTINMSTITENSSVTDGGGVWFDGDTAGNAAQADVTITGTILTGNTGFEGAADDLGSRDGATSQVATISDSILGVVKATITVTASNNIDATAPGFVLGLAALADNGGATETMALLTGSPAIDAGPATVPTFLGNDFDQRGTPYVRVYNGQSDIGAFELQPDPTPATTTTVASDESVVPTFTG